MMFHFTASAFYFLLIIILLVFSGNLVLKLIKLNFKNLLENSLFSLTLSLVLLSLLSYFVLVLNLSFLLEPIFGLFVILGFLNLFNTVRQKMGQHQIKLDWALFFLTLILTFLMVSVTARSGWQTGDGWQFIGVNAHDGMWHLSLIGELKNYFPPQHPNFSGIELKDYHYLLDLLLAKFSLVFGFSEVDLYFRFFPMLTAALWCLATFLLAQKYFRDKNISYLTVFFSVLGGSFAYFLPLFHREGINFDSAFGVSSPVSSLINLQFAFSIPILTLSFYAFSQFLEEKKFAWGALTVLFSGALFGFKIYAGMIAIFAIGLSSVFALIKTRKIKNILVVVLGSLLGAFIYLPTSTRQAGLVFAPGEMVQSIVRGPLSWTLWELQRQIYAEHNNFLALTKVRFFALLTFIFGNLGTKALGIGEIFKLKKSKILNKNYGLFALTLIFPFLIPLFFIQAITPFNIVQFWWYFVYLMSYPTAVFIWNFLRGRTKMVRFVFLVIVFFLTTPAAAFTLSGYLFPESYYKISPTQLSALNFLRESSKSEDIILEIPARSQNNNFNFGLPVIPALTQRRLFLGSEIIEFPYLDRDRREKELNKITAPLDCVTRKDKPDDFCQRQITSSYETLKNNQINYIFSRLPLFWLEENSKMSSLVYARDDIFIYRIK